MAMIDNVDITPDMNIAMEKKMIGRMPGRKRSRDLDELGSSFGIK